MRKAKVIEQHKSPRSYIVKTEDGNHLRRNRSHLLLRKESSSNGSLDNKMNGCDRNESHRTEISQQNIGTNSYVTRFGRVIKKPVRFGDTEWNENIIHKIEDELSFDIYLKKALVWSL